MAQYTVIQDIEAEDKLLGPLSLRQFIYAGIVIVLGFIAFQLARAVWFLALPFVPPMVFFGLLAAPFGQIQSSEVWLLAKIRYFLFPRRRIWDQTGLLDLVQITVPKKVETTFTKGYSEDEVTSRLKALANTLDTRGWAVKNVTQSSFQTTFSQQSNDRLLTLENLPNEAEAAVRPSEDVLNVTTNPVAEDLSQKLDQSSEAHRQELLDKVHALAAAKPLAPSTQRTAASAVIPTPAIPSTLSNSTVSGVVHPQQQVHDDTPPIPQPIINNAGDIVHLPDTDISQKAESKKGVTAMTTPANTDILDDVKGIELAAQTKAKQAAANESDDEVVISLR